MPEQKEALDLQELQVLLVSKETLVPEGLRESREKLEALDLLAQLAMLVLKEVKVTQEP